MSASTRQAGGPRAVTYQNRMLTLATLLLGVIVIQNSGAPAGVTGEAQAGGRAGQRNAPFNAAEQRKRIRVAIERLEDRVVSIQKKMGGTMNVRVTSMPPVRVKETEE